LFSIQFHKLYLAVTVPKM